MYQAYVKKIALSVFALTGLPQIVFAATMSIADAPLYGDQAVAPMTMLVMGRDHKLYYEAYNDASDLDGDGAIDMRFKPAIIYYGYFDPTKCYSYGSNLFTPVSSNGSTAETGLVGATCGGSQWSGNWLNYITTSRMDALRKVLYGGYRSTDTSSSTILERSFIPQDAHSWGKEYTSNAVDGYNINQYTPFSQPTGGKRHLFANTTLLGGTTPLLRVAQNQNNRIWEWVSIERPVADAQVATGNNVRTNISSITDYTVRVAVCVSGLLEDNCREYGTSPVVNKPVGILQELGENDSMKFGLITGSYGKNMSGGVLRKNIGSITDEINQSTGVFNSTVGIIGTINRLKITGFGSGYEYGCGFIFDRDMNEGECRDWGNPIAEMMYEALRYYAGKSAPSAAFAYTGGDDATLGLPAPAWTNPYSGSNLACSKPNMLVISDINPSYDSDQVPGSAFNSYTGDLSPAMNVSTLGQTMWTSEFGGSTLNFIGTSGASADGNPTAKTVTSFGNIRGLAPEEPNKQGSYYAGSVAYYGRKNDINTVTGTQNVYTYAVALASPLPEIKIPVNGQTITILPFGKSVGGCMGAVNTQGAFQATNTIVDFYAESITPTSGVFRINFEDAQQGADHDMDAIVKYTYVVNGNNTVSITLDSVYGAGCIIQHIGYIISGTTADGIYLEVRDSDTGLLSDVDYYLDTPNLPLVGLPLTTTRTFTPSSNPTATTLKNPLWYAAKWGSFTDTNNNSLPDLQDEYDLDHNGVPDNYFLVTNPLQLKTQLTNALASIASRISSASSAAINSGILSSDTKIYQALYDNKSWQGHFLAFSINTSTGNVNTNGTSLNGAQWDSSDLLNVKDYNTGRQILSYRPDTKVGIPFRYASMANSQKTIMKTDPVTAAVGSSTTADNRLNYIRGNHAQEQANGGSFRNREHVLGDIVNSSPIYVAAPDFYYPDNWGSGALENASPYSTFKASSVKNRRTMIYVGANDGMLHGFDAATGDERFAYVPNAVLSIINKLTDPNYSHRYYVDGTPTIADVFTNGQWRTVLIGGLGAGGQGIYALDVTNPDTVTEANAATKVLWEFADSNTESGVSIAKDLGYTFSRPAIVRLANGKWGAVFGNGYNNTVSGNSSTTGNAALFIVDIATGLLIKKIDTGVGMSADPQGASRPNGLSTPAVVDENSDAIADYVYAGDLFGNLWKFDISNANPSNWVVAYGGTPMFTAQRTPGVASTRQPITTRPSVSRLPGVPGGFQIYFGTGKFLESADKTNTSRQTIYAVQDRPGATTTLLRSNLLQQTILYEGAVTNAGITDNIRITSDNALTASSRGWYLDLYYTSDVGERIISDVTIRREKLIFTTFIPTTNPCDFGGDSWLMELDSYTGTPLGYSPFDVNHDGLFTDADKILHASKNRNVSGKKSTVGVINTPAILTNGVQEYKITPGSSGEIGSTLENPGTVVDGRQSWRELY